MMTQNPSMARKRAIKSKQKRDDPFQAVAKHLECDTDMDRFLKKLGKIARAKPSQSRGSK